MQLGVWQLLLILVVVLIFFGAGKLPRVMKDVGHGMRNLRKGLQGEEDPDEAPAATAKSNPQLQQTAVDPQKDVRTQESKDNT